MTAADIHPDYTEEPPKPGEWSEILDETCEDRPMQMLGGLIVAAVVVGALAAAVIVSTGM